MPVAVNKSGDAVYLTPDGKWGPAKTAKNPQTGETVAFDGNEWKPIKVGEGESRGIVGFADDVVRSVAEGATFGFSQEGAAALQPGDYESNLAAQEARDDKISPWVRIPGNIAGAVGATVAAAPVAVPLGLTRLGVLASRLPQTLKFAGLGAAEAALFGAGSAKPGERLQGAATNAPIGAVAGGAAPHIARGVGAVANRIKGAVSPEANVAADLSRALVRDETSPAVLQARAQGLQMQRPGVATIADAGGENVRGLVERVAQTPGAGRTQVVPRLEGRQRQQAFRIGEDLRQLTGTSRSAYRAVQETMAERAAAATPLYREAYEAGDRAIWTPELERLAGAGPVARAMRQAVSRWQTNAIADGFGAMKPRALADNGVIKFQSGGPPAFPNIQFWDYTKQALDDMVAATRNKQPSTSRALTRITQQLRTELDNAVPEYRAARDAWSGPSAYMDAIEQGRNIFNKNVSAEEWAGQFNALSSAEQQAARLGVVSSIIGKMGNDASKFGDMTKFLRSPEMRAKIEAIMPSRETSEAWRNRLDFEVSASELSGQALGNSATARRLAERADAESLVGDLVLGAISGQSGQSILMRILGSGPRWLRDTLRSRADRELGDVLTNPERVQDLQRILQGVQQANRPPSALTNAATTAGGVGLIAGP